MRRMVLVWVLVISCLIAIAGYLKAVDFQMTQPASQVRADWNDLFTQVLIVALIVAVLVWGLLIYAMVRFRARKDGPKEGPHIHGNVKLEIAWTIAPAAVMAWLLVLSFNGLFIIEEPEEEPDFTVKVTAYRFGWIFEYPDGTQVTNATLRVEQNRMVRLELRSEDVIHAFGVPQLAVMKDAVPGRVNYAWFKADLPGEYEFNCRELCGVGHSRMGGKVVVFPEGSEPGRMFGYAPESEPAPGPGAGNGTAPPANGTKVDLGRFVIIPSSLEVELGTELTFLVENVDTIPHNLFIDTTYDPDDPLYRTEDLALNQVDQITASFETDQTYLIWCNIPGHYEAGMRGELIAGKGGGQIAEKTPLLPGFDPFVALGAVGLAVALLRRRI